MSYRLLRFFVILLRRLNQPISVEMGWFRFPYLKTFFVLLTHQITICLLTEHVLIPVWDIHMNTYYVILYYIILCHII